MSYSPTPYRLLPEQTVSDQYLYLVDASSNVIADIRRCSTPDRDATAEFIKKACNQHTELQDQLDEVLEVLERCKGLLDTHLARSLERHNGQTLESLALMTVGCDVDRCLAHAKAGAK